LKGPPVKTPPWKAPPEGSPCPCGGGAYRGCCGRYHLATDLGASTLTDPSELVRARFSAFALGHVAFVRATESRDRPILDRLDPRVRYKRLTLLDADRPGLRVLFAVDVLARGEDASFVELSSFAIEDRLVYVAGITRKKKLGEPLALTIADHERLTRS
jgi:SEC-C motif-containing protein